MVGNKSDLDGQRDVTFEEAKQFADENGQCTAAFYTIMVWALNLLWPFCL